MNVNYIILTSKEFASKYHGIAASLACGFESYPDEDYYSASIYIKKCLKAFYVTENYVTFDIEYCNTRTTHRGPFKMTAIYDCKSEPFYIIPEPWNYVDDMIERCTSIDLNQTAISYDKFFDEFEESLKNMSADEIKKIIQEVTDIQTRVIEFYGHLMLAEKEGYLLPERYQDNLYWRLGRSVKWEDKV